MLEYIKMAIISFVTAIFSPVAASASAHYTYLDSVLNFSKTQEESIFFYSIITLVFSVVCMFFVRQIYFKGLKAVFSKKKKIQNAKTYKNMMKGVLISLLSAVLMLIPVSKEKIVLDYFSGYLWKSNIFVSAFCSFAMGFVVIIAAWFSKQKNIEKHRNSSLGDVLRITVYQTVCHIFPGLSPVALSASGLIVSAVSESVVMRDVLIYTSPSLFAVSIMRIIRSLSGSFDIDIIKILICALISLLCSILMLKIVSKINIKKSFIFFSVYSIIFGIFMSVSSLFIL